MLRRIPVWLAAVALTMTACQKEEGEPVTPSFSVCRILSESSDRPADVNTLTYQYDNAGLLTSIIKRNAANAEIHTVTFGNDFVLRTDTDGDWLRYTYNGSIAPPLIASPSAGDLNIHGAGGAEADYMEFKFTYDGNKRLTKIVQTSPNYAGDYEWDMFVTYNGQGNVSELLFVVTSGPPVAPRVTITGYDNNATPYRNIINYRFLMNKFHWNNPDVEPLITALSQNNPTAYTIDTGLGETKRTMTYTYNEDRYPTARTVTEVSGSNTTTFTQQFTYSCD